MKQLYFDCSMGAAGDMLGAALLELMPDPEAVLAQLNAMGIPGVTFSRTADRKCGIAGTQLVVQINGDTEESVQEGSAHKHQSTGLRSIEHLIADLELPEKAKSDALAVYRILAESESRVHGIPVNDIHFHEVGTLDAVADITAFCLMMERIAPDSVSASAIHVGSGSVRTAHGILPVPAPATAEILKGVPVYGGEISGELCTPTGAALLRHFAGSFGTMPVMSVSSIGYGMGKKDFPQANCVRAMLGESVGSQDRVCLLSCTLDDMSAEDIGCAMERLFAGGALDVFTVPIGMKKNRPGTMLSVICRPEDKDCMVMLIFRHTSTIGIRVQETERCVLDRETELRMTGLGELRVKKVSGYGVSREKFEYEDLARIAREQGKSIVEIRRELGSEG